MIRRLQSPELMRRLRSPELIVMGVLAAVCGLFLAILLSAEFGASSGPPAALKTVTNPAPDLAKLRPTLVRSEPARRPARQKRAHHAKKSAASAPSAPKAVAQVQTPSSTADGYAQGNQQSAPVQQLSAPSNPAPAPVKKPASHPKRSGSGSGGTFDDSG